MFSTFKTRKPRPHSEKDLKQRLTRICSTICRLRQPFCVLCGENNWNKLEAGHFWHRDMPPTEFDLLNLNTLCHACNMAHEANPRPYRDYMLSTLGERDYHDLATKAHAQTKIGYVALFELHEQMETLLTELRKAA